jgi:L-cysteine/cystine lyase
VARGAAPRGRTRPVRSRPRGGGDHIDLKAVRAELPVLERVAYLNAGTFGPLPRRSAEAGAAEQERNVVEGRAGWPYFERIQGLRESVRQALARVVGAADPSSIALTTSTTEACNAVVGGLRLGADDEVVTTDVEHPGLLGALRAWGVTVRIARVRDRPAREALAAIDAELSPRTRLVALSHVAWTTGAVLPIRELSAHGIPVLVDGAQGAGAIPVDVAALGCDFYTVSGQKWLLGPDATGCLYVRPERVGELAMTFPSYLSWQDPRALEPWPNARRFESAWVPPGSLAGLLASLSLAEDAGEERFTHARRIAELCRELVGRHAEVVTEEGQGTLVAWRPDEDAAEVAKRLVADGIVVRDLPGEGWVRASCGFWTSEEEIERLAEAIV